MAKGQKSSATSATRKKHATKAAGGAKQELPLPKEKKKDKGKGKGNNKEPRVKVFIPPSKPAPVRPDPLDSLGIAKRLPPELLVVLRRLGKKDSVTKRKALEELQSAWVDRVLKGDDENGTTEATLEISLTVWLHHVPSLLLNASRRIRLLAATIHASLLRIPLIHEKIVYFITETGDATQVEWILGSWCMATEDVERAVATQGKQAWNLVFRPSPSSNSNIDLNGSYLNLLLVFIKRALFDPLSVYADLNPVQPSVEPSLPAHASPRNKGGVKRPPMPLVVEEDTLSRRPEEEEENESDRKGRFRGGALGVLRWLLEMENIPISEQLSELLASPLLWTSLFHGPAPPYCSLHSSSGFIGDGHPVVRKAGWTVLRSLLRKHIAHIDDAVLSVLSSAVLRSAWVEPDAGVRTTMWEPLLKFLTQFPQCWSISMSDGASNDESEESDEESGHDTSGEEANTEGAANAETLPQTRPEVFREFLLFLELGCYGSPAQGYPAVVIILSTIPPSILGTGPESWSDLLTSFWAALDGRALTSLASERALGSVAFLSALLECVVLLVKRSRAFSKDNAGEGNETCRETVKTIINQQLGRVWEELVKSRLKIQNNVAGQLLARTFASLANLDDFLFAAAWETIASSFTATLSPQHTESPSASAKRFTMQLSLLRALLDECPEASEPTWSTAVSALVCTATSVLVEQADKQLASAAKNRLRSAEATSIQRLVEMLKLFGELLFKDADLAPRIDTMMSSNVTTILRLDSAMRLLVAFLSQRGNDIVCLSLWRNVLKAASFDAALLDEALPMLLGAAERGDLSDKLRPDDCEMDGVVSRLVTDALASRENKEALKTIARRLLERPYFFISPRATSDLIHTVAYEFSQKSRDLMRETEATSSLVPLRTPLMLLSSVVGARPTVALSEDVRAFLPDIFIFGHVLPRAELLSSEARALCIQARQIWTTAINLNFGLEERDALQASIRSALRDLINDVNSRASPEAILQIVSEGYVGSSVDLLSSLFPSQNDLEDMLHDLPSNPLDPILAIVDPLIPPRSMWREVPKQSGLTYDRLGLCEYARVVNSLLLIATDNRDFVRENMWLLRHFLILSLAATERQLVPSAVSTFFSQDVAETTLQEIASRVQALTAFLLSDVGDENWHASVVQTYRKGEPSVFAYRNPSSFVLHMFGSAAKRDGFQESKTLNTVLQHTLNGALTADAEQWMILARQVEKQSPNTALAIVHAVNESGLEPPSLDRYRNEVAAGAISVRASKASTDGLALLHRLALVAPDPSSDVVFLPQNRAVNFVKVCQAWIASDEDIHEDVESEMTLVFQHLAPILQTVPGAHWDLVFDVIENNLENCSFNDISSLVTLARTLRLILTVQDLCGTNKSLRAVWQERELLILTFVRDIVQGASATESPVSVPRSVCWDMALTIVQKLPSSLIDHESLPKMVHLILDLSPEVAKMAYSLLFRAARKRTEYLVVEAGVDSSPETAKYEIPSELLQVLQAALESDGGAEPKVLAYLLGWMIVFDLFDEASLRVKISYATQLRDLDLIGSSFLPFIFELLEVYGGRSKPFPLEQWSVEEYFVQFYDPETRLSPRLLAAHLFYRALLNVPSLISNWSASCKDRQLLTAVSNLTTKYYSPVLIAAELQHIRDPEGVAELSGENWSVKVAAGIGEVTASYTVDEQAMEITIRLPYDYPLHGIEVREVQKLGIEENRWRGWLLAVQQIITSQNGRIIDGLSMFKKNVTHHFENQTECAICYSIISVTELSLPKKRCKTCRNRFHAGCLFKWFNTSHTSSCPLCRSDFI